METSGPLHGEMRVPGSKSITNRMLVCAALAAGDSLVRNASRSDDSVLLANGLNQLGVLVRTTDGGLLVQGTGGKLYGPKFPIPVGNAGTTFRFLLALAALAEGRTLFETGGRMAERPNDDLLDALRTMGAAVRHDRDSTRFEVTGGGLSGGEIAVQSSKSSQFVSSVLMVAPYARRDVTVIASGGVASAPYILLTLDVMKSFGVDVRENAGGIFAVKAPSRYRPGTFAVEPDASGASYPFAAAAIAGGRVFVPDVNEASRQGDAGFVGVLRAMGCTVTSRDGGLSVERQGAIRGIEVAMNGMPDVVPTLLAVALFADGPSRISQVGQLRYKESDRLEGLAAELRKLGADIAVRGDEILVRPAPLHGAMLGTHDDHRCAMSFALIGLRVPGVGIDNADCVRKSYPEFWQEFERMVGG